MLAPSEPRPAPGSFSSSPSLSLSIISSTSESASFFFSSTVGSGDAASSVAMCAMRCSARA